MMSLFLLANVVSCNEEVLILQNEYNVYNIDFFNLIFYSDEKRIEACKYLSNGEITIEKEPLAIDGYYIYVDNQLIQEIAIENEWAKIILNYPEYLHIIEEDKSVVITKDVHISRNNHSITLLLSLFFVFIISLSLLILVSKM